MCLQRSIRTLNMRVTAIGIYNITYADVNLYHTQPNLNMPLAAVGIYKVTNIDVGDDERRLERTW